MVQLLMGSPQGVIDGLVVINGGRQPEKIVMPDPRSLQEFGKHRGEKISELLYTSSRTSTINGAGPRSAAARRTLSAPTPSPSTASLPILRLT